MKSGAWGARIGARANNFNLLRLIAATAVIFSHASIISTGSPDFLERAIGYNGGWIAVSAFFSISGMLIYLSIMKSRSIRNFLTARFLRIFPGLWVMLGITIVSMGVAITTYSVASWISDAEVYGYFFGNALLYFPQQHLPGLFEHNPLPSATNGSLWTLRFEFTCYLAVLVLFLVRAFDSERAFALMLVTYLIGYAGYLTLSAITGDLQRALYDGDEIAKLHRLSFAFLLGIVAGRYIDRFRPAGWMVALAGACAWLALETPLFLTMMVVFVALAVFWVAFLQHPYLVRLRQMPDYSYGIYIYAFPVQQSVEQIWPLLGTTANATISCGITLIFASASWHLVEKPALDLKIRLGGRAPAT